MGSFPKFFIMFGTSRMFKPTRMARFRPTQLGRHMSGSSKMFKDTRVGLFIEKYQPVMIGTSLFVSSVAWWTYKYDPNSWWAKNMAIVDEPFSGPLKGPGVDGTLGASAADGSGADGRKD